jgi:large subunit ribosomal protein L30
MANATIKITLKKSTIGKPPKQKKIVKGLGLTKLNQTVERPNTREIRGMVKKVIHLVEVEE